MTGLFHHRNSPEAGFAPDIVVGLRSVHRKPVRLNVPADQKVNIDIIYRIARLSRGKYRPLCQS
ncbi:MAG: hypothetical protein OEN02_02730 [Gammaproteobacteria bacterium]|nr:hypothetical protein [Gammaproteobacteria bacterium]MDH3535311.1 hypothetical protein [Gammaproteobacteria bacterium]